MNTKMARRTQGGLAPNGKQYYMLTDTDGFVWIAMDPVTVAEYSEVVVSGWVNIQNRNWADADRVKLWVTESNTKKEAVILEGHNFDSPRGATTGGPIIMNSWKEYSIALPQDWQSDVVMQFGLSSDHSYKAAWFDHFSVKAKGPDRTDSFCNGKCKRGEYKGAGMGKCMPCQLGETSDGSSAYCSLCPEGTWAVAPGQCMSCDKLGQLADGSSGRTSPPGSTSPDNCTELPRIIGYTSFEEPVISTRKNSPSFSGRVPKVGTSLIPNRPKQNPTVYTACTGAGKELGFRTYYTYTKRQGLLGSIIGVIGDVT